MSRVRIYLAVLAFCLEGTAHAVDFRKEVLAGYSLSLIENAVIEVYHLRKDGTMFAELGTELGPPGGYAGTWMIEKGRLLIADRKTTTEVFELIEQRGTSQVKVRRRNGDTAFFTVSPTNE